MPVGSISSSPDTVGVAVVNYRVPVCESHDDVVKNCHRIAQQVEGLKRGYPGLDLVIFPEYSTQGFHPVKWPDFTTTLDGPEVKIFKEACVKNGVCDAVAAGLPPAPADSPLKCSYEDVPVMKPSKLALEKYHAPRSEETHRTGVGLDASKHGYIDDDITTEEGGRWKDGLSRLEGTKHRVTQAEA